MTLPRWRLAAASVVGTSHKQVGTACQDSYVVETIDAQDDFFLAVFASDGAGTASASEIAARLTCRSLLDSVREYLSNGNGLTVLDKAVVLSWIERARMKLVEAAAADGIALREYACTVQGAVLGTDISVFVHLGDGATVIRATDAEEFDYVSWPQKGEYANTTNFITDPDALAKVHIEVLQRNVVMLAMFTDGLEGLALDFRKSAAHTPFFKSMFRPFNSALSDAELSGFLERFLDSPDVNARTDDDKTLVLATRVEHDEVVR